MKRIKHNDLTHYFMTPHEHLPASYLASCEKFFKAGREDAAMYKRQIEEHKRQAPSTKQQAPSTKQQAPAGLNSDTIKMYKQLRKKKL